MIFFLLAIYHLQRSAINSSPWFTWDIYTRYDLGRAIDKYFIYVGKEEEEEGGGSRKRRTRKKKEEIEKNKMVKQRKEEEQ